MPVLHDSRGNEQAISPPDAITGQTFTDARAATVNMGALNAETVVDLNGAGSVVVDARTAAGALTYVFEGTVDGTNYMALPAFANFQLLVAVALAEQYVPSVVIATTHSGIYTVSVVGFRRFRVRVSAYTSGNVTVGLRATAAIAIAYDKPIPSTLHVTATAAANAAATATLPAAGAGLFHYITHISITRNATAALAGTATLIHTTTNLPGNPAWSVGNAIIAGGTEKDVEYAPTTPLKSSVANTATTVVAAAAGAAVLARVNVSYYIGS